MVLVFWGGGNKWGRSKRCALCTHCSDCGNWKLQRCKFNKYKVIKLASGMRKQTAKTCSIGRPPSLKIMRSGKHKPMIFY